MKRYFFLLTLLMIAANLTGQIYRLNDTLYMWEMHGGRMIANPEKPDQPIGKFFYGAAARVVDTEIGTYPVKMEVNPSFELQGHWVKVIMDRDTGYVFDGYLSHLKPFDLRSDRKGIDLVGYNFSASETIGKDIRSFNSGKPAEGQSRSITFYNGITWNLKNVMPCLVETFTCPKARFTEAYQFMMAVYSNYFDQKASYMAEPEFVRMNGSKYVFILKEDGIDKKVSLYKNGKSWIISAYSCSEF